jgi:hypothetical protein
MKNDPMTKLLLSIIAVTTDTYPFHALNSKPQTSHPFEQGRFAFEDMDK